MAGDAFRLGEERLGTMLDEHAASVFGSKRARAAAEGWSPSLETLVVAYADRPELHEAPEIEQLAWFVWVLATSGCLEMPEDFPPHGVLGLVARGPEHDDERLVLEVRCEGGPRVASEPISIDELIDLGTRGEEDWAEDVVVAAKRLARMATRLIPAARAAADER
jgi:hypothetical protein